MLRICLTLLLLISLSVPVSRAAAPLPPLAARADSVTVSGLSSGAFMAGQFHVAFSSRLAGAGLVAGGPYYCAAESPLVPNLVRATTACMNPCRSLPGWLGWACADTAFPNGAKLAEMAAEHAEQRLIDPLAALATDRVYLFSGDRDRTVHAGVVEQAARFYQAAGVPAAAIRHHRSADAGHGFVTDNPQAGACGLSEPPFITNCGFDQARVLLEHLYGPLATPTPQHHGELLAFDQRRYIADKDYRLSSLADTGYYYLPDDCRGGGCRLHVVFHGCGLSAEEVPDPQARFYQQAGYNQVAASNRMIVLYPQLRSTRETQTLPMNPRGCWDFWGYSGAEFHTQDGAQMAAVWKMVEQLLRPLR